MRVVVLYTLFAAIATVTNLGSQALVQLLYKGPYDLIVAILVGTFVGLVVKYLLDKRYIFAYRTRSLAHDGQLFVLYAAMSLITTVIFWGFEYGFELAFGTDLMRYLGGLIGLAIGYFLKYQLDKRFVFRQTASDGGDEG